MIEPFDGTLYDPCCGSGGMFIQSAALVKSKMGDLRSINIYGQEKEPATYRLAKMNLALGGISHNLGTESDSSFINDLHKGRYFDYIMANPPFNLKGRYGDTLAHDPRWAGYRTPSESNANYAWILHILSHLKPETGVAGFLLANGALNDSDTTDIRQKLIENDKVEAIIYETEMEREATAQALSILESMHESRESFRNVGLTFEEKAFYDILLSIRDVNHFEYGEDVEKDGIIVNEKCRDLAKKVKDIIDTQSSFSDWINNQSVRNMLEYHIKVCLIKNKYPPQYSSEVFEKVMQQVENFEENAEDFVDLAADDPEEYGTK